MSRQVTAGLAGVLAVALAVGTSELVAGILPGDGSPFVAVGDLVIGLTPGAVVRFAISTFGDANRRVLVSAMTVVMAVAAFALGVAAARRRRTGIVGILAFAAVGALIGLADPLLPTATAVLAPLVGAAVGVGALLALLRAATPVVADAQRLPDVPAGAPPSRRGFLGMAAAVAGGALVSTAVGRSLQRPGVTAPATPDALPAPESPVSAPTDAHVVGVDGVASLVTPNDDFFRIDTALTVPRVKAPDHRIRINGMVDEPFEVTYDELLDLADTEAYVTLSCVSNEVGGDLVGHARWQGVPLATLLERAGVQSDATQIVGRSVDGWTGGFPVEAAFDGRTALVAVGMNGEPLPERHGFPARLVIAGLYGYVANTKWLSQIILTTFEDEQAYWIPRGWSARGPIKTQSRIDVPARGASLTAGTVPVAGVAWADEHGVSRVEVAVDDGPWQPAELADELAAASWRQWRLAWDATPGEHVLRVRAFDADGEPQTASVALPAPDGATGHHTIEVSVA